MNPHEQKPEASKAVPPTPPAVQHATHALMQYVVGNRIHAFQQVAYTPTKDGRGVEPLGIVIVLHDDVPTMVKVLNAFNEALQQCGLANLSTHGERTEPYATIIRNAPPGGGTLH